MDDFGYRGGLENKIFGKKMVDFGYWGGIKFWEIIMKKIIKLT